MWFSLFLATTAAATGAEIAFTYDPAAHGSSYTCSGLPCSSGYPATFGGCAAVNTTGITWCCPANHTTCWRYGTTSSACAAARGQKQCRRDDYSWCCAEGLEYCDTKNGICLPEPAVFANPLAQDAPASAFASTFTVGVPATETTTTTTATTTEADATTTATTTTTTVPIETALVGVRQERMSTAAVVGVGVGVTAGVMLVGAVGWFLGRQWQRRSRYREDAGEKMLVKPQRVSVESLD